VSAESSKSSVRCGFSPKARDLLHRGGRQAARRYHRARAPGDGVLGRGLERAGQQGGHLLVGERAWDAPPWGRSWSPSSRPSAKRSRPLPTTCFVVASSAAGDRGVAQPCRRPQDTATAARSPARGASACAVLRRHARPSSSARSASPTSSVLGTRQGMVASLPDLPLCTEPRRRAVGSMRRGTSFNRKAPCPSPGLWQAAEGSPAGQGEGQKIRIHATVILCGRITPSATPAAAVPEAWRKLEARAAAPERVSARRPSCRLRGGRACTDPALPHNDRAFRYQVRFEPHAFMPGLD
jgi:hypothetical protein